MKTLFLCDRICVRQYFYLDYIADAYKNLLRSGAISPSSVLAQAVKVRCEQLLGLPISDWLADSPTLALLALHILSYSSHRVISTIGSNIPMPSGRAMTQWFPLTRFHDTVHLQCVASILKVMEEAAYPISVKGNNPKRTISLFTTVLDSRQLRPCSFVESHRDKRGLSTVCIRGLTQAPTVADAQSFLDSMNPVNALTTWMSQRGVQFLSSVREFWQVDLTGAYKMNTATTFSPASKDKQAFVEELKECFLKATSCRACIVGGQTCAYSKTLNDVCDNCALQPDGLCHGSLPLWFFGKLELPILPHVVSTVIIGRVAMVCTRGFQLTWGKCRSLCSMTL
jgi:hypothetical protein